MPDSPDSPVQMILFDVGRVLIQLNSWTASFPEDVFPREGLAEKVMRFTDSDEYFEYETGHVDSSTFLDRVRTYFGVEGSDEILSDYFCRQLGAPMPGMESLLDELSDAGFRLCGFSNTTEIHGE